jgi:5-hydroxytryptamine receptor 1
VFVIAAILLERHLQNVANYLILSLAVADLLVACLVMPLGAVYEVSQQWTLGPELCDMWTSSDVLCCTASILHLVAIAVDRYVPGTKGVQPPTPSTPLRAPSRK